MELGALEVVLGLQASEFISGMSNAEKAVSAFAVGIADLAKDAIEAASEAQNAASQVAGIFGSLAPEVVDFAEKLGHASGRATSDVEQMVSSFGAMVAPMVKNREAAVTMSEGLSEMAINMEKAFHVDSATAVSALRSALAGSARGARQFGIDLSQAAVQAQMLRDHIGGTAAEMSSAQRTLVMYQLVMGQSADMAKRAAAANGDFSEQLKQIDAAGKELSESFGGDLLPAASAVASAMRTVAEFLSGLPGPARHAIEAIAGLTVAVGVLSAAGALLETEFAAAMGAVATSFGAATVAAAPFLAVGAAVVALAGAIYYAWERDLGGVREKLKEVALFFSQAWTEAVAKVKKIASTLWDGLKSGSAIFRDVWFAIVEGVMDALGKMFAWIGEKLHQGWATNVSTSIGEAKSATDNVRQGLTSDHLGQIASSVGSAVAGAVATVGAGLATAGHAIATAGGASLAGVKDMLSPVAAALSGHGDPNKELAPKISAALTSALAHAGPKTQTIAQATGESTRLGGGSEGLSASQVAGREQILLWAAADKTSEGIAAVMGTLPQHLADAASAYDWSGLASDLAGSLTGAMGKLGSTINSALQGLAQGGPMGMIVNTVASVLEQSVGFQQAMAVLTTIFQEIANVAGQLFQGILPLLGTVQNLLQPILEALVPVIAAVAPLFEALGGFLQLLMPIFNAVGKVLEALAPSLKLIFQILSEVLTPIFEALAPIFQLIGNILTAFAPILKLIAIPLQMIAQMFTALQPVFQLLADVMQGIALVIGYIVLALAAVWDGMVTAVQGAINGIIDAVNVIIAVLDKLGARIKQMGTVDFSGAIVNLSTLQQALSHLTGNTYDGTDALGAMTAQVDQATASLANLPQGYKVALAEFQNMNTQGGQGNGISGNGGVVGAEAILKSGKVPMLATGGIVSAPTLAIIGEAGPEAVVPLSGSRMSSDAISALPGGGAESGQPITINATIVTNEPDVLWQKLQALIKTHSMARYGRPMPGVPRFALPGFAR